ncbi:MAG: hypothetical protein AB1716_16025 [Planctomycetota bacterium]
MIVTLDGRRVESPATTDETLQALIDRIRAAEAANRLIISVSVDGQVLGEEELNAALPAPLAAGQVDLQSADRAELVQDVLHGLAREFGDSAERLGPIADALTTGDVSAAMRDVGQFIGLWQTCYRGIAQCSGLLGQDLTQCAPGGRSVQTALQTLLEKLTTLRQALEARDTVLVSDLVRYELPPLAEEWQTLLDALAANIQ